MSKNTDPRPATPAQDKTPPEGPHAKPAEVDESKTPGSGMFPKPGLKESEPPSG